MNTVATLVLDSFSSEDTYELGVRLGKSCKGGEVFVFSSDLGGGKTTLTKGLGSGLGSDEIITSPTFTVSNIYKCAKNIELHHFDFYRLNEAGIMSEELTEVIGEENVVTAIEWGDIVDGILPEDTVKIIIDKTSKSEDSRKINIIYPKTLEYLVKELN